MKKNIFNELKKMQQRAMNRKERRLRMIADARKSRQLVKQRQKQRQNIINSEKAKGKGAVMVSPGVYKFPGRKGLWKPPRRGCACG